MRAMAVISIIVMGVACGGKSAGPTPPSNTGGAGASASPSGGWVLPGSLDPDSPGARLFLCVGDHRFGMDEEKAASAAERAACGRCTWSDDGTGHCKGHGMHSEFDLTWKLAGDELTLSHTSDHEMDPPSVFRRDPTVDCASESPVCED